MKKLILGLTFLFLLFSKTTIAQIPNGDFSNWALDSVNYWDPVDWITTNTLDSSSGGSVLRDADRLGGPGYSVKFSTVYDSVQGYYIGGDIQLLHAQFTNSIRPSTLSGYLKINNVHLSDQLGFDVGFFNSSNVKIGSGGYGTALGSTHPNWSPFSMNINYTTNDPIAYYNIEVFFICLSHDTAVHCQVDDIDFDVSTNDVTDVKNESFYSINKSNEGYTLEMDNKHASKLSVHVFDINGKDLLNLYEGFTAIGKKSVDINLNTLSEGIYFCRVESEYNTRVFRLIK